MDKVISIIHITTEKNLKKILKDGYIKPYESELGKGVYTIINLDKDLLKKRPIINQFGNYVIELDKELLLNRNDYVIHKAYPDELVGELFGGEKVFDSHLEQSLKDKKRKLNKVINNLTLLNEVIFDNKISLNKYKLN
jgi:hypothetical protein